MPKAGKTSRRGYGHRHQQLRARWAKQVEAGYVDCYRCGRPIAPGSEWDLGHDDHDRTLYTGPEHRSCNRATAGRRIPRRRRSSAWGDEPRAREESPKRPGWYSPYGSGPHSRQWLDDYYWVDGEPVAKARGT